jgi:hypothetical protein
MARHPHQGCRGGRGGLRRWTPLGPVTSPFVRSDTPKQFGARKTAPPVAVHGPVE